MGSFRALRVAPLVYNSLGSASRLVGSGGNEKLVVMTPAANLESHLAVDGAADVLLVNAKSKVSTA